MNPIYSKDGITLYCGKCEEVLPGLGRYDLIIADPPYGMHKETWDELIPWERWLPTARKAAKVLAVFCGVKGIHDYPKSDWCMSWTRQGSTQRNGALRGFNNWEPILLYGEGITLANDVISLPNYRDAEAAFHKTPKPLKLIRKLIGLFPCKTICDPYAGSGTSGVAAKLAGLECTLIEQDAEYCEKIITRLRQGVLSFGEVE